MLNINHRTTHTIQLKYTSSFPNQYLEKKPEELKTFWRKPWHNQMIIQGRIVVNSSIFISRSYIVLACVSLWIKPAQDSGSPWRAPPSSISSTCCSCTDCWLSTEASLGESKFMEFEQAPCLSVALNHVKNYFRYHYLENFTSNTIGIIILTTYLLLKNT